ncbi:MAG: hypothetical protein KKA31_03200 [Candidatus Margulisbacteria bacterium]|nr:hypothetical protein [Candidatus Margulisiibacteriota bacterium]
MSSLPVLAVEIGVGTGLTRDPGDGAAPIVKVKWEMNVVKDGNSKYLGTDDATTAGAQFLPSSQYQVNKRIAICAVVTDADGMADLAGVYADVFYPVNIAVGEHHVKLSSQNGSATAGCGVLMQEDELKLLSTNAATAKADGIELICNKIRTNNTNLPVWNSGYDYDEICAADGELMKETAKVFCVEKDLSYEDPAGDYRTIVMAQDTDSLYGSLENFFKYLPSTAFEVDFTSVNYGNVKLNTHKVVNGNLTFSNGDNFPTVRNIGNTRADMKVQQDDMGLGQTGSTYNVKYDGRVGSDATFVVYNPFAAAKKLNNTLDLSETNEMDFSIDISKFPYPPAASYSGTMTLTAVSVAHLTCPTLTRIDRVQTGFGDGGWAGWSCPVGTTAVSGGIDSSTNPVGPNGLAVPSTTVGGFTYPVYPHYTYTFPETGYVVQDLPDGFGNTISFHVDCLTN